MRLYDRKIKLMNLGLKVGGNSRGWRWGMRRIIRSAVVLPHVYELAANKDAGLFRRTCHVPDSLDKVLVGS